MGKLRQFLVLFSATAFLFTLAALAQDDAAPSLGDVARQARQQKQQKDAQTKDASATGSPSKDAQAKDAQSGDAQNKDKDSAAKDVPAPKPSHVITNEDLPEHINPSPMRPTASKNSDQPGAEQPTDNGKASAEEWRSQIMSQKSAVANLKNDVDSLNASIQYAPANCVSGCVEWNERQKQKQEQVETMKAQLAEQEKRLEEMQESARKQGYGSSVYDP
jgi:hypothetical protein